MINKLRALCAWYSKEGLDSGSHLRVAINSAESVAQVRHIITDFFMTGWVPFTDTRWMPMFRRCYARPRTRSAPSVTVLR